MGEAGEEEAKDGWDGYGSGPYARSVNMLPRRYGGCLIATTTMHFFLFAREHCPALFCKCLETLEPVRGGDECVVL